MTIDDPYSFDAQGTMTLNYNENEERDHYDNVDRPASNLSEDELRRMILESYERAGVDLPLVSLETVLDREISEDDARQTGAPRFRKFLNKASSVMVNRALNTNDDESEEGPDDEVGADAAHVLSSTSYTSNSNSEYDAPRDELTEVPQTPERAVNNPSSAGDTTDIIPPTPESMKNDCHPTFDFCCPKTTDSSPTKSCASDKYVMSNLQIAEGFDDEQHSVDVQESRDVPALMDMEDSVLDDTFQTDRPGSISKGQSGMMSYFRGSRRFRYAILFCCILHVVLVGLIIAFVTKADEERYEAGSSAAAISQGQTATTPPSTNTGTELFQPEILLPDPDLEEQLDPIVEDTTSSSNVANSTEPPIIIPEEDNVVQETITGENTTIVVVEEDTDQPPVPSDDVSPSTCVNSLEVNLNCFGEGSELYVNFESCTPQPGDWVALFESSADPQSLLDSESFGWLYTCGDRFCEEAVQKEVLSFTRAKDRAEAGTYRFHLMREGEGPAFPSIVSTSDFRIVTDDSC